MSIGTALVAGDDPLPQLAEAAAEQALARAGLSHAEGMLLFLTPDFARDAHAAVMAASRRANCLRVSGSVVAGLATERNWVFDRPAAAAMVFGGRFTLGAPSEHGAPRIALAGATSLPPLFASAAPRIGTLYSDALMTRPTPTWNNARIVANTLVETSIAGAQAQVGVSTGVRQLGTATRVENVSGHDLHTIGGQSAADSLRRALPAEYRTGLPLPVHLLALLVLDEQPAAADTPHPPPRLIPLVASNADGSLTVGELLHTGQRIRWAIRQPVAAEADMRAVTATLKARCPTPPDFGLFFSCIGRGPYFYGDDDRDWLAMRELLPDTPLLGVYGSGQIAPYGSTNHLLQNAVVLTLFTASGSTQEKE